MSFEVLHSENLEKAAAIHLLEIITGVFIKQVKISFTQESNLKDLSPYVLLLLSQRTGFLPFLYAWLYLTRRAFLKSI